ncbi:hypothetical protein IMY05_012G0080200 [Salix suchowensis]|nr:hypothetical protein IMY05_012G0080200 [Salix suchowensis]
MNQYLLKWNRSLWSLFLLTYSPLEEAASLSIAVRKDQNSPLNTPSMTQYSREEKERVHLYKWRGRLTRISLPKTCMALALFCSYFSKFPNKHLT